MTEILQQDIQQLLDHFSKNLYRARESEVGDEILQRCGKLMRLDYSVAEIPNLNGELSANYPAKLLIPEHEVKRTSDSDTYGEYLPKDDSESGTPRNGSGSDSGAPPPSNRDQVLVDGTLDAQRLRSLILKARGARCRTRFPLPVILYNGKYICRSATLSGGPEIYGRSGLEYLSYGGEQEQADGVEAREESSTDESESKDWVLFGQVRRRDIRLLKALNVGTIIDFMVENKKVKFGVNITSSEKVDKENRYSFFKLLALPYPGCEFFREFRNNQYEGDKLIFDWNQSYVDAGIRVPEDSVASELNIDWANYKKWDLKEITQNYLRLLLKYLQESSTGILVHCISGWDRTPLFVSLLRVSLWADGVIHQSLSAAQVLYLTIAYDWMLFGHNLPDRLNKGELIFFFCFQMLKHIMDDEYSVLTHRSRSQRSSTSSSIDVIRTDSDIMLDGLLLDGESRGSTVSLNSASSHASGRSHSAYDTQTSVSTAIGLTSGTASNSIAIANRVGNGGSNGGAHSNNGDDSANSYNGNNRFAAHSNDSSSSIGFLSNDSSNHNTQWSPEPSGTSPVTVPSANRIRQRQESTSSISLSGWQMITAAGSYRSTESVNDMQSNLQQLHQQLNNQNQNVNSNNQQSASNGSSSFNLPGADSTVGPSDSASTPNANHISSQTTSYNYSVIGEVPDPYAIRRERLNQVRTMFHNCYCSTIAFTFVGTGPVGSLLGSFAEKVGLTNRSAV